MAKKDLSVAAEMMKNTFSTTHTKPAAPATAANDEPAKASAPVERIAPQEEIEAINAVLQAKANKPKKESQSARIDLYVKPALRNRIKAQAAKYGISVNELVTTILDAVIEKEN